MEIQIYGVCYINLTLPKFIILIQKKKINFINLGFDRLEQNQIIIKLNSCKIIKIKF